MNRRQSLKLLGASTGALAGAGLLGRYVLLPPGPSRELAGTDELARRLVESFDDETRGRACVEYDHPLRQYHNRGVGGGGLPIDLATFSRAQRGLLTDLFHAALSEAGRERVPDQFFVDWLGVHLMKLLVCGDPRTPPYQIVLTGPHLNLRIGGASREGVAFGGPQVYGDQRGDERQGLPRNRYRYQFLAGHGLLESLTQDQRRAALLDTAPIQTQIELQGAEGVFPGVPVRALFAESKALARGVIDGILSTYAPADVAYAWRCLEHNGGVDALSLAYYADGEVGGSGEYQIFRLEGPAAVFFFRGYPHVHAFVNVAMDGERPLSVGEVLGESETVLEGAAVKRLFEAAMRAEMRTDLAHYDADTVAGKLRKGTIRTGDVYNLESWQDHVAVVEVRGSRLSSTLVEELEQSGSSLDPDRLYTVATTGYVAREEAAKKIGNGRSGRRGRMLRDVTIDYLVEHGFPKGT